MSKENAVELGIALCIMELGKMEMEIADAAAQDHIFHAHANAYRCAAARLLKLARGGWIVEMPGREERRYMTPVEIEKEAQDRHGGITDADLAEAQRLLEAAKR